MSDFEQWALNNGYCHRDLIKNANGDYCTSMAVQGFKAFNGAIASMHGEANFDLSACLNAVADMGFWPQVIYDDNGNWAIWDEGSSNMRLDDDMDYHCSFLIPAEYFKPSLQEAWSSYVERLKELGNDVSELHSNTKQSMQVEAVGVVTLADDISQPDTSGEHKGKYQNIVYSHAPLQVGAHVYTHAPDSAARIAEQSAEIARLQKELEEARKALSFYANSDHYRRILPWLQENNWRESLKKSGWVHLSTERDDEEYWVEGGQIADAAIRQIGGAE